LETLTCTMYHAMPPLSPDTLLTRNATVLSSEVSGKVVMMDVEAGKYFGLNGVGSRVWALLETPRSVAEIARLLSGEYDVTYEDAEQAVLAFAASLQENALATTDA
jgi:hypothetical protein